MLCRQCVITIRTCSSMLCYGVKKDRSWHFYDITMEVAINGLIDALPSGASNNFGSRHGDTRNGAAGRYDQFLFLGGSNSNRLPGVACTKNQYNEPACWLHA